MARKIMHIRVNFVKHRSDKRLHTNYGLIPDFEYITGNNLITHNRYKLTHITCKQFDVGKIENRHTGMQTGNALKYGITHDRHLQIQTPERDQYYHAGKTVHPSQSSS